MQRAPRDSMTCRHRRDTKNGESAAYRAQ
jgi:hypothetical protein